MNYSKLGYLLAKENELKINNLLEEKYASFNCEFYNEENLNLALSNNNNEVLFPTFAVRGGKYVYITLSVLLQSEVTGSLLAELVLNDNVLMEKSVAINQYETLSMFFKADNLKKENVLKVVFKNIEGDIVAKSVSLSLMGSGVNLLNYSGEIAFGGVKANGKVWFYYIKNNKLYIAEKSANLTTLKISDFEFKAGAKSASICVSKEKNLGENKVFLFRVDSLGNLYISNIESNLDETFLLKDISLVSCAKVPDAFCEDMLVCVMKNGVAGYFFISFENGEFGFSAFNKIPLKNEVAMKIMAVDTDSSNVFIVVRTEKNNYIFVNADELFESYCVNNISVSFCLDCALSDMNSNPQLPD